jgi:hypothetical protein
MEKGLFETEFELHSSYFVEALSMLTTFSDVVIFKIFLELSSQITSPRIKLSTIDNNLEVINQRKIIDRIVVPKPDYCPRVILVISPSAKSAKKLIKTIGRGQNNQVTFIEDLFLNITSENSTTFKFPQDKNHLFIISSAILNNEKIVIDPISLLQSTGIPIQKIQPIFYIPSKFEMSSDINQQQIFVVVLRYLLLLLFNYKSYYLLGIPNQPIPLHESILDLYGSESVVNTLMKISLLRQSFEGTLNFIPIEKHTNIDENIAPIETILNFEEIEFYKYFKSISEVFFRALTKNYL